MEYPDDREYDAGLPLRTALLNNFSFVAHWHIEIEFLLVLEGQMTIGINSETRRLSAGDMAICKSGDFHYYDGLTSKSKALIVAFPPHIVESCVSLADNAHFVSYFIDQATVSQLALDSAILENIRSAMKQLHSEMDRKDKYYKIFVQSLLFELIGLVLRHLPMRGGGFGKSPDSAATRKQIQKAIKYIEKNFAQPLSLADVSRHLGISEVYFSHVFIKLTGLNFKVFINKIRIEKAEGMIRFSNDPIEEIANKCGFSSIRTFNRVFKSITGITPTGLR